MLRDRSYEIEIGRRADWTSDLSLGSLGIICYTDGSRSEGRTGYGAHIELRTENSPTLTVFNFSRSLGQHSTVFQSELCAILDAALTLGEILSNGQYRGHPIYFYSDSMSSLQALKGHETNSKLVLECHAALNKLAKLTSLTFT